MSENDPYCFYEVVPAGYNLLDAPPDQLDRYGIPRKPDAIAEPRLFEFWKRLVSPPFSTRRPTFSSIDPPSPIWVYSSMREVSFVPSRGGTLESSLNWSGAVVSPPWPKRVVFAAAGWIAPNVRKPSAPALFTHSNDPKSLVWVGLDGHNGRLPKISLPQIGTAHWPDPPRPGDRQHFAWWDWWCHPKSSSSPRKAVTRIADFAVDAGHEVLAGLAVLISEDVLFFIKNQSTGEFRSFLAKRQPLDDIEPLGSSVEWVLERPTNPHSGKFYPLAAYYDSVDFKYCLALAADGPIAPGRLMTLADNGRMIKMREAFADPYRTAYVSRAKRRRDPDGSIGVTCTFHEPM
jgi:peptidase A4-like protein